MSANLRDSVDSDKMQKRRIDKETAALTANYSDNDESEAAPVKKRTKREIFQQQFETRVDVRDCSERGTSFYLHC